MAKFETILEKMQSQEEYGMKVVKSKEKQNLLKNDKDQYFISYSVGIFDKKNKEIRDKIGPMDKAEALEKFKDLVAQEKHFNKGK